MAKWVSNSILKQDKSKSIEMDRIITTPSMVSEDRVYKTMKSKRKDEKHTILNKKQSNPHRMPTCSNTQDRLCELLLPWSIVEDITNNLSRKSTHFPAIPIRYTTNREYVDNWEPLLIEEIRTNILNNIPTNTRDDRRSGTVNIAAIDELNSKSSVIRVESFFKPKYMNSEQMPDR